jgi:hypothetical protein
VAGQGGEGPAAISPESGTDSWAGFCASGPPAGCSRVAGARGRRLLGQQSVACGRAGETVGSVHPEYMVMRIHDHMYGHHDHVASFGEA